MRVIDQELFADLQSKGDIKHDSCDFLDGVKIGLHIEPSVMQMPRMLNANDVPSITVQHIDLTKNELLTNQFYLAKTTEQISISNRIIGFLHTRSWCARIGLDCLGSSNFVSPGFGNGKPLPLILELRAATTIFNLDLKKAVAAMVLFELDWPVRVANRNHHTLFPFGTDS
jgi:hypothetical protein